MFRYYPRKAAAERRFPIKLDVQIPPFGFGRRLTDMLTWCRECLAEAAWDQHHHAVRSAEGPPEDYARFYFAEPAVAERFRRKWMPEKSSRAAVATPARAR